MLVVTRNLILKEMKRHFSRKTQKCIRFFRIKELDQILFTNSARNMPHLFWSRKIQKSAKKRTNPYLSTTANPGVHQLNRSMSAVSPSVYQATTEQKDQSTRVGLVSHL